MSKETKPSGKKVRRQFSDEFKRDAVNLVVIEGYSFKRAAGAVGVSPNSLRGWYAKLAPDADAGGEDPTNQSLQEEIKRLRKQLREAQLERDILKKATAFFAKESQ
jgi:transposase